MIASDNFISIFVFSCRLKRCYLGGGVGCYVMHVTRTCSRLVAAAVVVVAVVVVVEVAVVVVAVVVVVVRNGLINVPWAF